MMPYFAAVCGFLTTLTLPFIEPAISSRAGAIWRQGPHHSAQKSTTTGSVAFRTSLSKVASETLLTPIGHLFHCEAAAACKASIERMYRSPERQDISG